MAKGKNTCRILKEIRKQIAEANDIEFVTEECRYKGDCLGTCPKCEAEVRYLEEQLLQRRKLGKAVAVVGVSLGLSLGASAMPMANVQELPEVNDSTPSIQQVDTTTTPTCGTDKKAINGKYRIKGKVIDNVNEPIIYMEIRDKQAKTATISNFDGYFEFCTDEEEVTLTFSYVGYKTKEIKFKREDYDKIQTVVFEDDDELLMGEVVVVSHKKRAEKSDFARFLTYKECKKLKKYERKGYVIHSIKGQVVSKDDETIIGANISDKKGNCVGVTNIDGEFNLYYYYTNKIKEETLTISYFGFKPLTITVKEEDLDKPLKIVLEDDEESMEEFLKKQNWAY